MLSTASKLGPYEVSGPLGAGGMGEVYRARDSRLGRVVAIKVLPANFSVDPERLRRFEQEARAAAALSHPNLLEIHDVGTQNGLPYIVTELLEGETLRERLRPGPLSVRKATEYALQVARGLAAAHEKGIVHRDLKPENIFITRDGRVKILDFGVAKLIEAEDTARTSAPTIDTTPGVVLGTVGYMSPEQVRGQSADHRSDLFSFGAILYEMLSGKRAFKGDTPADTMSSILKDDPPELTEANRNIPPGLERIVRHCLEKNPEERFQSARDVAFDLQSLSTESSTPVAAAAARRLNRRWVPILLGAAVAVAFVLGFVAHSARSSIQPPNFQRLTFRRGLIPGARLTPDGKTAVYAAEWGGNPVQLFAVDLAEPSQTRELQLPSACVLAMSPNSELAVVLEPIIWGHLFCRGTLARAPLAGGAPRELLDNVEFADWNHAGTDMAIVHFVGGRRQLEYPMGKVLYSTPGWISDVRISPAGDAIAFLDHPIWPDDRGFVSVVDTSGRRKVLTSDFSAEDGLAWSADGKEIWVAATPTGGKRSFYAVTTSGKVRLVSASAGAMHLFDISRDGRVLAAREDMWDGIRGLGPDSDKLRDLSWLDWSLVEDISPDGKLILLSEEGDGAGSAYRAYLRRTDGSVPVELGEGQATALSHDGKWALGLILTTPPSLVMLPTRAGSPRRIERYNIEQYSSADFLPDDKHILFCGNEPQHGSRFYVQPLSGEPPKPVSAEGMTAFFPSAHVISPDGKFFIAIAPDQQPVLVPLEGGEPRPAAGIVPGEVPWRWADTHSVFVVRRRETPIRIYRVDVFTGKRQLWKEVNLDDRSGLIAVSIFHITPDGNYYAFTEARGFSELYSIDRVK